MVDEHGYITTIAGTGPTGLGNGPTRETVGRRRAQLNAPAGLVFDVEGDLLISDQGNDRVRMLHPPGRSARGGRDPPGSPASSDCASVNLPPALAR